MRYASLALFLLLACTKDTGGPGPVITEPVGPGARALHGFGYFPPQQQILMFGGNTGSRPVDEFWAWSNGWTRITAAGAPSARLEPLMIFDSRRNRMLLYGGHDGSFNPIRDLWAWDGTSWSRLSNDAPALMHASIGFDPERDRVVVAGGTTDSKLAETWEFDGTAWRRVSTAFPVAGRELPTEMVFNTTRRTLQMAVADMSGGSSGARPAQLWEWNGTAWSIVAPATVPTNPPGSLITLTAGELLLIDHAAGFTAHRFNGTSWTTTTPSALPPQRFFTRVAVHAARNVAVLFGGSVNNNTVLSNETWLFNGTTWTRFTS